MRSHALPLGDGRAPVRSAVAGGNGGGGIPPVLLGLIALERTPGKPGRAQAYIAGLEDLARRIREPSGRALRNGLRIMLEGRLTRFLSGPEADERRSFLATVTLDGAVIGRWCDVLVRDARRRACSTPDPDAMTLNMLSFLACRLVWRYVDQRAAELRAARPVEPRPGDGRAPSPAESLIARLTIERLLETSTPMERRVLEMLFEGYTQTEIARQSDVSRREVGRCMARIRRRLRERGSGGKKCS